jgi:hypothetical protein
VFEPRSDWFESEVPVGRVVREDLQRLRYRAVARWPIIVAIALAITALGGWMLSKKEAQHRARIVLAVLEGDLSRKEAPLPMADLRDYVSTVLMPSAELEQLIERRDLFPLRHRHGIQFGVAELWDMIEIETHRNYFLYEYDADAPRSARIVLTVIHADADLAWDLCRDLASIIIASAATERQKSAQAVADEADRALVGARARVTELDQIAGTLNAESMIANERGQRGRADALAVEAAAAAEQARRARTALAELARTASDEQIAADVSAAGLGLDVTIVEERPPVVAHQSRFRFATLLIILSIIALIGAAIVVGTFDSRIRDVDDIARLGIPVVGQVPGFPGDGVGALHTRGIRRRGRPGWRT